jgi:ABC-type iron transport system FetAB ATPase subunit
MAFYLNWTETGVEIRVDGDFANQMVAINKALTGDPRSRTVHYMVFDVLRVDNFYADASLVATLAEFDVAAYAGGPHMRLAVVTTDQKMEEILHIYADRYNSLNAGGVTYRVFSDMEAARIWCRKEKDQPVSRPVSGTGSV